MCVGEGGGNKLENSFKKVLVTHIGISVLQGNFLVYVLPKRAEYKAILTVKSATEKQF